MDKIYSKKKKNQKNNFNKKIKRYIIKSTAKNNNSRLVNKKISRGVIQKGGSDPFNNIVDILNLVWTKYSDKTKELPNMDLGSVLFMKVSQLIPMPGLMQFPMMMLTHFVGAKLVYGSKYLITIPLNKFYNRMKYQIVKYEPERISIKETWFMKIISLVNGLFNKVLKNRHSIVIVGGLSIFLYLQFFYPKENPYLFASKFLICILTTRFFIEIFLDNNLSQLCHSELKKGVESNKTGGKYAKKNYKGSGTEIINSTFCSQKINDKITIMLLNLKQQITGISENEDLLLQKKTKTGIFEKRQISTFKSFKLEMYKILTGDEEYEEESNAAKSLGSFLKSWVEHDVDIIKQKEEQEYKKKQSKDEMNKLLKEIFLESNSIKDNEVNSKSSQSGGNVVSGLIHNIFLVIKSLCKILKYEVSAIKSFIIVCLNICLKMITKGFNGLRVFYIFIKKCFIPLTLLTIMLFLHLKFGQKIKQYLKSKILG